MKRKIALAILCSFLVSCNKPIVKGTHQMRLFVATDLHLFSNNLIDEDNQIYMKDNFTTDGRVQEYDYQLVEELINQINEKKPSYAIFTGDLSYNGEKDSHLELIKLLNKVNNDTKILVIPGNHDCYSLNAIKVNNDEISYVDSITMEQFKEIYKDFGYQGALSYDESSLSYVYELSDDKWILMLDTTLSKYNEEFGSNIVMGELSENTLMWIEENLKIANQKNIEVISATHHNLLTHNELFKSSYTLYNSEQLLDLYYKYGVKINFSGHLHIQSIKEQTKKESKIYDISNVSLLDYGNRYGEFDIYDNCYEYQTYKLNPKIEGDFQTYSFDTFYKKYYDKNINSSKFNEIDNVEQIVDLISKINCYYFDGDYEKIHDLIKENKRLIRNIKTIDNKYINSIISVENKDQNYLIIEK